MAFIEGEQELIEEFKDFVKCSKPEDATVSELSFEDYEGHVMSVDDYMQLSIVEHFDKGVRALLRMDKRLERRPKIHDMMPDRHDQRVEGIESDISNCKANAVLRILYISNKNCLIG